MNFGNVRARLDALEGRNPRRGPSFFGVLDGSSDPAELTGEDAANWAAFLALPPGPETDATCPIEAMLNELPEPKPPKRRR